MDRGAKREVNQFWNLLYYAKPASLAQWLVGTGWVRADDQPYVRNLARLLGQLLDRIRVPVYGQARARP